MAVEHTVVVVVLALRQVTGLSADSLSMSAPKNSTAFSSNNHEIATFSNNSMTSQNRHVYVLLGLYPYLNALYIESIDSTNFVTDGIGLLSTHIKRLHVYVHVCMYNTYFRMFLNIKDYNIPYEMPLVSYLISLHVYEFFFLLLLKLLDSLLGIFS